MGDTRIGQAGAAIAFGVLAAWLPINARAGWPIIAITAVIGAVVGLVVFARWSR